MLATGRVAVYQERGKYQLYVTDLRPLGQGALELAFRQLCERLDREGLVCDGAEKAAAAVPAPAGAGDEPADRGAAGHAEGAAAVPVAAAGGLPRAGAGRRGGPGDRRGPAAPGPVPRDSVGPDVILLGRGGGSIEDLWCFNDEAVARAIAASRIPVVTGIGHEVDTSIADLVADYHAHTPTEAAQVVVQHWRAARDAVAAAEPPARAGGAAALAGFATPAADDRAARDLPPAAVPRVDVSGS